MDMNKYVLVPSHSEDNPMQVYTFIYEDVCAYYLFIYYYTIHNLLTQYLFKCVGLTPKMLETMISWICHQQLQMFAM
jgi:hypothetical protein